MTNKEIANLIYQAKRRWGELRLTRQFVKADQLKYKINLLKRKLKNGLPNQ